MDSLNTDQLNLEATPQVTQAPLEISRMTPESFYEEMSASLNQRLLNLGTKAQLKNWLTQLKSQPDFQVAQLRSQALADTYLFEHYLIQAVKDQQPLQDFLSGDPSSFDKETKEKYQPFLDSLNRQVELNTEPSYTLSHVLILVSDAEVPKETAASWTQSLRILLGTQLSESGVYKLLQDWGSHQVPNLDTKAYSQASLFLVPGVRYVDNALEKKPGYYLKPDVPVPGAALLQNGVRDPDKEPDDVVSQVFYDYNTLDSLDLEAMAKAPHELYPKLPETDSTKNMQRLKAGRRHGFYLALSRIKASSPDKELLKAKLYRDLIYENAKDRVESDMVKLLNLSEWSFYPELLEEQGLR